LTDLIVLAQTEMMMTLTEAVRLYDLPVIAAPTRTDLVIAAQRAAQWRREGPLATGLVLLALHDDHGLSYRQIEEETGIVHATAERLVRRVRAEAQ
jgi:hypothetical protein